MPTDIRCPNCGSEIPSSCRFCPYCATRLCTNCHKAVPQDTNHCPWCNFLLIGTGMPQAPQVAQPPGWSQPTTPRASISGPSPWSQPTPPPPASQRGPADSSKPIYQTPGGFIIGRQPAVPQESPPPSQPSYPYKRTTEQIDKTPTHPTSGLPSSSDAYNYDARKATIEYSQPKSKEEQQAPRTENQTWEQAGIKDVRGRFPSWMIAIIVILAVGLVGLLIYSFGLHQGPTNSIKELASKIEKPSSIPFISSLFNRDASEDNTPPEVSNVLITNVTSTGAVITWVTDEPATSQVMFCNPDGLCQWTEEDKTMDTSHSITITGLNPNTKYHYTISSLDASQNEANSEGELITSGDGGPTTTPTGPLLISDITVSDIGETSATIEWKTTVAATGQVEYGKTEAFGLTTPVSQQPTTEHSLILTGLEPSTTYHFKLRLSDTSGNEVTSEIDRIFTTSSLPPGIAEGIKEGMRAPNFTLQDIVGKSISLSDYRGKLVMINFWGGGYQRCRNEMHVIQSVYNTWADKGLVVLGVNYKEDPTKVQEFIDEKNITYTILVDPTAKVYEQYGTPPIPSTFFLDESGIIRQIWYTAISNAGAIEATLESMQ